MLTAAKVIRLIENLSRTNLVHSKTTFRSKKINSITNPNVDKNIFYNNKLEKFELVTQFDLSLEDADVDVLKLKFQYDDRQQLDKVELNLILRNGTIGQIQSINWGKMKVLTAVIEKIKKERRRLQKRKSAQVVKDKKVAIKAFLKATEE